MTHLRPEPRRWALWAWLAAAALLLAALAPYDWARSAANRLAGDGQLELFTPTLHLALRALAGAAAAGLAAVGGLAWARPAVIRAGAAALRRAPGAFARDAGQLARDLRAARPDARTLALLAGITLAGLAARWVFIERPMSHDEAYTYLAFASGSLRTAMEDYHLPNNHILHSILMLFSTRLFGIAPWALRLPACLSGALLAPLAFGLARRWYGREVGLLAAGFVAAFPALIDYSTNARGYSQWMLISLACFWLGAYLRDRRNLAGWGLLALLTAAGFYTLPVMLYPFGALWLWFACSALAGETRPAYGSLGRFAVYAAATALAAGVLTLLLYTPVFLHSGPAAFFGNEYVQPLPAAGFWPTLHSRLLDIAAEWSRGVSGWGLALLALFALLSLLGHGGLSRERVPFQATTFAWLAAIIVLRRPNLWPRVISFLIPLVLIWAAAGSLGAARRWLNLRGRGLTAALAGALIALGLGLGGYAAVNWPAARWPGSIEQAVLWFNQTLRPGDLLIVMPEDDAATWYYMRRHGIAETHAHKDEPFLRMTLLADRAQGQTYESVMAAYGPEAYFIRPESVHLALRLGTLDLYQAEAYPDRILEEYGRLP